MKTKYAKFSIKPNWLLCPLFSMSALLIFSGNSTAQTLGLSDGGSTATVDLTGGGGMNSWTVLGQNQLQQQWFYYSVNGSSVQAINQLGAPTINAYSPNLLDVTYANSQLSVEVQYSLTGGGVGSGAADMAENLYIKNVSGADIANMNFFQYSHFNLLGTGNNSIQMYGDPVNGYGAVQQSSGATAIQEAIALPNANGAEAALAGQTLSRFATIPGYNLNDNLIAGPGDVTWAFEWSQGLNAGDTLNIIKDKNLQIAMVPEPSTLGLIALGVGAFGSRLLRRRN